MLSLGNQYMAAEITIVVVGVFGVYVKASEKVGLLCQCKELG